MPKLTADQIRNLREIPAELAEKSLWCGYLEVSNPNKPKSKLRKRPHLTWAKDKGGPKAWKTLSEAIKSWAGNSAGLQRFVSKEDGLIYIDLDHARSKDGTVEPWAQEIITRFDTFTEISASGTGFHLVCRGTLAEDYHMEGDPVEIYSGNAGKIMAMTGDLYGARGVIHDCQAQATALFLGRMKKLGANVSEYEAEEAAKAGKDEHKHWREIFHTGAELGEEKTRVFIEGFLEEGITYFGGLSDVGKTWIGLSIAHALISGEKLFGLFPVLHKCNVLYLVPEMGRGRFRARLLKMRISMDGNFFCQTVQDGAISLDDPNLLDAIRELRPAVILDTAIRFQGGQENDASEQAQGLGVKMFRLIREGAQCVICMHHRKKDAGDEMPTLENTLRGTGDFGAHADCVWCVEHEKGKAKGHLAESKLLTRLRVTNVKPRDMEPVDPFTIQGRPHIDAVGDFRVIEERHGEEAPVGRPLDDTPEDVATVLELAAVGSAIGLRKIAGRIGGGPERVSRILEAHGRKKVNNVWADVPKEGVGTPF